MDIAPPGLIMRTDKDDAAFRKKFEQMYSGYFSWGSMHEARGARPISVETATGILLTLKRAFDRCDLTFWLAFGTALGAYRDGGFISYDTDIDVGIFHNDMDKLFGATELMLADGLPPVRVFSLIDTGVKNPKDIIGGISYGRDEEYVDVYFNKKINDKYGVLDCHWAPSAQIENLDKIEFLGEKFNIPSDTEQYLLARYGDDWRVPRSGIHSVQ